jgi:DNA-binding transcriptional ArsR family regulator
MFKGSRRQRGSAGRSCARSKAPPSRHASATAVSCSVTAELHRRRAMRSCSNQSQPRISRHLRLLTEAGFLDRFREQQCVYYRVPVQRTPARVAAAAAVDGRPGHARCSSAIASARSRWWATGRMLRNSSLPAPPSGAVAELAVGGRPVRMPRSGLAVSLARGAVERAARGTRSRQRRRAARHRHRLGADARDPGPACRHAVGIDISAPALRLARTRVHGAGLSHCEFRRGDMYSLPSEDGAFDTVTIDRVLARPSGPRRLLPRRRARCVPGGRLVVIEDFEQVARAPGQPARAAAPLARGGGFDAALGCVPAIWPARHFHRGVARARSSMRCGQARPRISRYGGLRIIFSATTQVPHERRAAAERIGSSLSRRIARRCRCRSSSSRPAMKRWSRRCGSRSSVCCRSRPRFVSVTYGADGSTRERTHHVVTRVLKETSLTPAPHLTCVGTDREQILDIARGYWQAGVRHIVALRGDAPQGAERYQPHPGGFAYAVDLVRGLKSVADFEISVAAFPEGHPEAPNAAFDLENLKAKTRRWRRPCDHSVLLRYRCVPAFPRSLRGCRHSSQPGARAFCRSRAFRRCCASPRAAAPIGAGLVAAALRRSGGGCRYAPYDCRGGCDRSRSRRCRARASMSFISIP